MIAFAVSKFINIFLMKIILTFFLLSITVPSFAQHVTILLCLKKMAATSEHILKGLRLTWRQFIISGLKVLSQPLSTTVFLSMAFHFTTEKLQPLKGDRNKLNYEAVTAFC